MHKGAAALRGGAWDRFVGQELIGRRVGLLGFGNIARKLSGFDVEVIMQGTEEFRRRISR